MSSRSREIGTASLGGLIVGGVLGAILSVTEVPFGTALGALIGGLVAGYLLYGKVGHAALAGALSGILGYIFFWGVLVQMLFFQIYVPPQGPEPPPSLVQLGVIIGFVFNLIGGAVGGAVMGLVRRAKPQAGSIPPPPPPPTSPATGQVKYCVQCGAQMPAGATICPHCNARQP